jgi:inosose dehydratase
MSTIDRRRFVQGLACAALTPLLPVRASAREEPEARARFGFSLYGMKSLKLHDALKHCAEIGYDGVELALMAGWPSDPAALKGDARADLAKQLNDSGLALLGLMENLPWVGDGRHQAWVLDRLRLAAEMGRALSPRSPVVLETILGGRPADWDKVKDPLAKTMAEWARVAEKEKMIVAVKPHVGNAMHTPEAARWVVDQVDSPWLMLAYDYSHFTLRGIDLAQSLEVMLPRTVFIHVKDAKGDPTKVQFLLPGDGAIDYASYFTSLKKANYRGPIVVEVSGQIHGKPDYDPVAAAKRSYVNLAPVMQKTGLRSG